MAATFVGENAGQPGARLSEASGNNKIAAIERIEVEQESGNLHALGEVEIGVRAGRPNRSCGARQTDAGKVFGRTEPKTRPARQRHKPPSSGRGK